MFKIFVDFAVKSHNVLMNFKRKVSLKKKRLLYHRFVKFDEYTDILMKNLGLKSNAARYILYHQQSLFDIPQEHIIKQCQLCQKLQVDPSTLFKNAQLLSWSSSTLRHRVLLLREMGVSTVHAAIVSNFQITMSIRMGLFKAYTGIPKPVNVADNLLRCLHEPPSSVPPLEPLSDGLTVNDYHKQCLRWYIRWRLNVSKDDVDTMDRLLLDMRHRSFRLMRQLFDVLRDDIGLTTEQIKKYACLSVGSSDDLCKIINEIKTFGGANFMQLIKRYPALHAMEYENVIKVMKLLDEHGFTNKALRRCPEILILDSNVIKSRLEKLENSPELRVLKNNAKVLILIHRFNMVEVRLEYLRYLNIKHVTIRNLTAQRRHFERFVRTGVDNTKGREIGYFLEKLLKLETKEIRRRIQKHPYWRHIDLVVMQDTIEFLLNRFAPEDLHENLQLLLYPREKIAETLENLPELNEKSDEKKYYAPNQILAICLYEIEREHHFSGDGVWKYDTPSPHRPSTSKKPLESELSEFSDSEIVESEEREESCEGCKQINVK